MTKPKILRVVFTQGTTVTLPQPVGSRSSLDLTMHNVTIEYHPVGIRITKPGMDKAVVVPFAQVLNLDEELESEVSVDLKRGPGRPKILDASH
jgi:hypothetical protein